MRQYSVNEASSIKEYRRERDLGTIGRTLSELRVILEKFPCPLFDAIYDRTVVQSVEPIKDHHIPLILGQLISTFSLNVPYSQRMISLLPPNQGSTRNSGGRSGHQQSGTMRALCRGSRRF